MPTTITPEEVNWRLMPDLFGRIEAFIYDDLMVFARRHREKAIEANDTETYQGLERLKRWEEIFNSRLLGMEGSAPLFRTVFADDEADDDQIRRAWVGLRQICSGLVMDFGTARMEIERHPVPDPEAAIFLADVAEELRFLERRFSDITNTMNSVVYNNPQ